MATIHYRGVRQNDVADLARLMQDETIVYGTTAIPFISEFEVSGMLEDYKNSHWIIAEADNKVVGYIRLAWGHGRWRSIGDILIGVDPSYTGHGVGCYLVETSVKIGFNYLNLQKVELQVYADNEVGVGLYKKIGFQIEGTKRRNAMRNGKHVDGIMMSILKNLNGEDSANSQHSLHQ